MALSGLLLAKLMPPSEYGIYGHALSVVTIGAIIGAFGTETFLFREMGARGGREMPAELRSQLMGFSVVTVLVFSLVSIATGGLLFYLAADRGAGLLGGLSKLAALGLILVLSLIASIKGAAKGDQRFVLAQGPDGVLRPLLLIAMILTSWRLGLTINADLAIALYLCAAAFALVVLWFGVFREERWRIEYPEKAQRREWLVACAGLLFVAAAMVLNRRVDVFMLGFMVDETSTGAYVLATRFADLVTITFTALGISYGARCARWLKRGDKRQLQSALKQGTRVAFLLTFVLVLLVWVVGPLILAWFNPNYLAGLESLRLLVVAQLINTGFGLTGLLLVMSGDQPWYSRLLLISAAINVGLNLLLVPILGVVGAAIATLVVTVFWNFCAWTRIRRMINIDSSVLALAHA